MGSVTPPLMSSGIYATQEAAERSQTPSMAPQIRDINWLFTALWNQDDKLSVTIPETIIFEGGHLRTWYFTNKEGKIMKRNTLPQNDYARVRTEFDKFHAINAGHQEFVAVSRKVKQDGTHTIHPMMAESMSSWLEEPPVTRRNTVSLQSFITSKYSSDSCFRVEYILQEFGKPYIYTLKSYSALNSNQPPKSPDETPDILYRIKDQPPPAKYVRKFTPSRMADVNYFLEKWAVDIVKFIETHENVKFLKISLYFIIDVNDKPWFFHATHITVLEIPEDLQTRSPKNGRGYYRNGDSENDDDSDYEEDEVDRSNPSPAYQEESEEMGKLRVVSKSRIHLPSRCYGDYCDSKADVELILRRPRLEKDNYYKIMNKSIVLARLEERNSKPNPQTNLAAETVYTQQSLVLAKDLKDLAPTDYYAEVTVCPKCYFIYLRKDMERRESQQIRSPSTSKDASEILDVNQQRDRLYAQLSRSVQRSTSPILKGTIVKKLKDLGETQESITDFIDREELFLSQTRPDRLKIRSSKSTPDIEASKLSRTASPFPVLLDPESPLERSQYKQAKSSTYPYIMKNCRKAQCRISNQVNISFKIMQHPDPSILVSVNFIVFNDFLDDFENFIPLFSPVVGRNPGCRIILFNYPGQPRTKLDTKSTFTTSYAADVLDSLITAIEKEGFISIRNIPTCLLSFGLGAGVAVEYRRKFMDQPIRSITMVNPVLAVDPHIAIVFENLYSADNATANHPGFDSIQTFFSHVFYSESYLTKQRRNRVAASPVNIYKDGTIKNVESRVISHMNDDDLTTLTGRKYLLSGFQNSESGLPFLANLNAGLVVIRSSEDSFAQANHLADILKIFDNKPCALDDTLSKQTGIFVRVIEGGHQASEEQPSAIREVMESVYEFTSLSTSRA